MLLNIKEAFSGQAYCCLKFRWCFIKFSQGKITPSIIQICHWIICNTSFCVWINLGILCTNINNAVWNLYLDEVRSTYIFQWRLSLFPSERLENVLTTAFELKVRNDCWTVSSWIFVLFVKYTEKKVSQNSDAIEKTSIFA